MNDERVVEIENMTWMQVEERLKEAEVVIIPVGSTEQHGPHLNLSTDTTRAHRFSLRVARHLYPRVLVAPPVPVGISPHHLGFAGSMTIQPGTLVQILIDYVKSLRTHGLDKFFIISGHGGNMNTIGVAAEVIREELGVTIPYANYKTFTTDLTREIIDTGRVDHAGEWEVSDAMFLAPELVHEDCLSEGGEGSDPWEHSGLHDPYRVSYPLHWRKLTSNGAMGDARRASAEKGKKINDRALERAAEFLTSFMDNDALD